MRSFDRYCARGIKPVLDKIEDLMTRSLMLVTALTPYIGYDKSASIARLAFEKNITLRQAAIESTYVTQDQFEAWVQPKNMI